MSETPTCHMHVNYDAACECCRSFAGTNLPLHPRDTEAPSEPTEELIQAGRTLHFAINGVRSNRCKAELFEAWCAIFDPYTGILYRPAPSVSRPEPSAPPRCAYCGESAPLNGPSLIQNGVRAGWACFPACAVAPTGGDAGPPPRKLAQYPCGCLVWSEDIVSGCPEHVMGLTLSGDAGPARPDERSVHFADVDTITLLDEALELLGSIASGSVAVGIRVVAAHKRVTEARARLASSPERPVVPPTKEQIEAMIAAGRDPAPYVETYLSTSTAPVVPRDSEDTKLTRCLNCDAIYHLREPHVCPAVPAQRLAWSDVCIHGVALNVSCDECPAARAIPREDAKT